jgi:eukaryotic-like serine/threonine-protein kinase
MPNLIGKSLGRYHILEQIGEGGMAIVYKAFDTRLEADVAIKVIRTDQLAPAILERALKRFEREAKALARLTHANIVNVTDYGEEEGLPFLAMPYLPGGTLKEKLRNEGKANWQDAVRLLLPIAKALAYAHDEEMVHRDVKPANILITRSGDPMLTDFGIAKIIDEEATMDLTGTRATVGTPEYMAPEQVTAKTVDHRADIYALGVVFYEMVTGRKPFQADTPMAVLVKLSSEPLPRPTEFTPKLSKAVEQVLLKALAKDPANRYQNMRELVLALEKLLQGKTAPAKPARKRVIEKKAPQEKSTISKSSFPMQYLWFILGGVALISILLGWLMGGGAANAFPTKTPTLTFTPTNTTTPTYTQTPIFTSTPTITPTPALGIGSTWKRPTDGMTMLYIPAGEFEMGSDDGDSDEKPINTVFLDAFWMDETEVTNKMFAEFLNAEGNQSEGGETWLDAGDSDVLIEKNSSSWRAKSGYGDHPVVEVTWYGARAYCDWAGPSTGSGQVRLPSEAEWEKAARGNVNGEAYPWGDNFDCKQANADDETKLDDYVVPGGPNCDGYDRTAPVGSFSANGYGLYDMSGNVWEWVNDWYDSGYYSNSPGNNPSGPSSGSYRVLRGGSWYAVGYFLRSADRLWNLPVNSYYYLGFRCSRSLP